MSWFSKLLKAKTGIPEINLSKDQNAIVAALAEEVARGKVSELLKKLPDGVFFSMYRAFKEESILRTPERDSAP